LRVEIENTQVSHHGHTETAGIPRAVVLTVSFVLSLVSRACCHHPRAMRKHCRELTPASGRQDHTTSPSAPPVAAKRLRRAKAPFVFRPLRVHRILSRRP
jgi:hypothetical protein